MLSGSLGLHGGVEDHVFFPGGCVDPAVQIDTSYHLRDLFFVIASSHFVRYLVEVGDVDGIAFIADWWSGPDSDLSRAELISVI